MGDMTALGETNVDGGFGFGLGALGTYYFSPFVGVYTGVEYFSRKYELNETSNINYIDIPLGVGFRWKSGYVTHTGNFGVFLSKPLDEFEDPGVVGGKAELQQMIGFEVGGATYFPVTEQFNPGMIFMGKFSFKSPFGSKDFEDVRQVVLDFGLSGRFQL